MKGVGEREGGREESWIKERAHWRRGVSPATGLASAGMAGTVGIQTVERCSVTHWESSIASLMRWCVCERVGFGSLGFRHLNCAGFVPPYLHCKAENI